MDKGYIHVEIESVQTSKKVEAPSGDVLAYERTVSGTTIILSDGITQAGIGKGLANGWMIEGVSHYINDLLSDRVSVKNIPGCVLKQARHLWNTASGDDSAAWS